MSLSNSNISHRVQSQGEQSHKNPINSASHRTLQLSSSQINPRTWACACSRTSHHARKMKCSSILSWQMCSLSPGQRASTFTIPPLAGERVEPGHFSPTGTGRVVSRRRDRWMHPSSLLRSRVSSPEDPPASYDSSPAKTSSSFFLSFFFPQWPTYSGAECILLNDASVNGYTCSRSRYPWNNSGS